MDPAHTAIGSKYLTDVLDFAPEAADTPPRRGIVACALYRDGQRVRDIAVDDLSDSGRRHIRTEFQIHAGAGVVLRLSRGVIADVGDLRYSLVLFSEGLLGSSISLDCA